MGSVGEKPVAQLGVDEMISQELCTRLYQSGCSQAQDRYLMVW